MQAMFNSVFIVSHLFSKKNRSKEKKKKNLSNQRKTFLWTNRKLCRTQTSLDSFKCMHNKKAHMLNIYCRLKSINFLKIKRVVLKYDVPIDIPWKKCRPEVHTMFETNPNKNSLPAWMLLKSSWRVRWLVQQK